MSVIRFTLMETKSEKSMTVNNKKKGNLLSLIKLFIISGHQFKSELEGWLLIIIEKLNAEYLFKKLME